MSMPRRTRFAVLALAATLVPAVAGAAWLLPAPRRDAQEVEQALSEIHPAAYGPQKVVYHVNSGGGLFDGYYRNVLGSLRNHVSAVGAEGLAARVVLQGPGLLMLRDAATNEGMRASVDWLRAHGVRFLICRNSLRDQKLLPSDLYGVRPGDVVGAGVAELARLEADGFVYLKL